MFSALISFILLLLLSASPLRTISSGRSAGEVSTIDFKNAPFSLTKASFTWVSDVSLQVKFTVKNKADSDLTAAHFALLVYKDKESPPETFEFKTLLNVPPGESREVTWQELRYLAKPVSILIAPLILEFGLANQWDLRTYYTNRTNIRADNSKPLAYPEIAFVSDAVDDPVSFNANITPLLTVNQPLAIVKRTDDSFDPVAHLKVVERETAVFDLQNEYVYAGKTVESSDRIRLVFPGMARLNITSKSMFYAGVAGFAWGGWSTLEKISAENKRSDATDPSAILFYDRKARRNLFRRDAAFIAGGIYSGASFFSQVFWGRHGKHLYPREHGFRPSKWNTTTRSYFMGGLLSLGSAFYFDGENRIRRNASYIFAGSFFSAAFINQYLLGNNWPLFPQNRNILQKWNPVSKSNLVLAATSGAIASYFMFKKSQANDKRKVASDQNEINKFEGDIRVNRRRRDAALILSGLSLFSSVTAMLTANEHKNDIFSGKPLIPLPGWFSGKKFTSKISFKPDINLFDRSYGFIFTFN